MITSLGNERIKAVVRMRQKAKARAEADAFLAEGIKMFLEAPAQQIREVYISESFSCPDAAVERALREKNPLLLLAEGIQDPGNLGTMIRAGEGAGIHGLILSSDTVDMYNPKTIRATMGSVYRVPFLYTDSLLATMKELQARGIAVYAAHLRGERSYDLCDFLDGTAFLIGNEGNGLRRESAEAADMYMKIPMAGRVESLNAGMAAAVLLYEAARQRRNQE